MLAVVAMAGDGAGSGNDDRFSQVRNQSFGAQNYFLIVRRVTTSSRTDWIPVECESSDSNTSTGNDYAKNWDENLPFLLPYKIRRRNTIVEQIRWILDCDDSALTAMAPTTSTSIGIRTVCVEKRLTASSFDTWTEKVKPKIIVAFNSKRRNEVNICHSNVGRTHNGRTKGEKWKWIFRFSSGRNRQISFLAYENSHRIAFFVFEFELWLRGRRWHDKIKFLTRTTDE